MLNKDKSDYLCIGYTTLIMKAEWIEIRVRGFSGNEELSPENFDIKDLKELLESVEELLGLSSRTDRSPVTYQMEKGSVRNIFKVSLEIATKMAALFSLVGTMPSLNPLEPKTANAFVSIQKLAKKNSYSYELSTSTDSDKILLISPSTNFHLDEDILVKAEIYLYGTVVAAGGKDKSTLRLYTRDGQTYIIKTDKAYLKEEKKNLLYKEFGARVLAKQNVQTGAIDDSSLTLLELVDYTPKFSDEDLEELIRKAKGKMSVFGDADDYVALVRGLA